MDNNESKFVSRSRFSKKRATLDAIHYNKPMSVTVPSTGHEESQFVGPEEMKAY